ncbi:PEP-CTERM sorting domain-containing protein [Cerasicoccus frondis]|uniref:PEP-CTERM sorting domain-containing protein n=1 Tax=Cerasicoccus frondis TaxID=490090 RepID=UPI00285261A0|nr:PEP-CTERM sorting domain-containing protein [Cerasicoccus frondis]
MRRPTFQRAFPTLSRLITAVCLIINSAATTQAIIETEQDFGTYVSSVYSETPGYSYGTNHFGPSNPFTSFSADFSALGSTTLSMTWSAPDGFAYDLYVADDNGWSENDGYTLSFSISFGSSSGSSSTEFTIDSLTIGGSQGAKLPTDFSAYASGAEGSDPILQAGGTINGFVVGEHYQFSNITLVATVPAEYYAVFTDSALDDTASRLSASIEKDAQVNWNPTPLLNLVAVPEPGAYALIFGLAIGWIALRRRLR